MCLDFVLSLLRSLNIIVMPGVIFNNIVLTMYHSTVSQHFFQVGGLFDGLFGDGKPYVDYKIKSITLKPAEQTSAKMVQIDSAGKFAIFVIATKLILNNFSNNNVYPSETEPFIISR